MMTAIEIFQAFGIVALGLVARVALVLAGIAVLSVPCVTYAYTARAVGSFWNRHHHGGHSRHAHGVA
jgi:hypothetical protein